VNIKISASHIGPIQKTQAVVQGKSDVTGFQELFDLSICIAGLLKTSSLTRKYLAFG